MADMPENQNKLYYTIPPDFAYFSVTLWEWQKKI